MLGALDDLDIEVVHIVRTMYALVYVYHLLLARFFQTENLKITEID